MHPPSTPAGELQSITVRGAWRAIAIAAVFWALAATLLYLLSPGLDSWPRLMVFHECVGMTMVVCVLLLRRTRAFPRFRPMTRWLLIGLVSMPAGFVVGHQIAFLLLGEPLRMVGYLSVSVIPVLFTLSVGGVGLHYYATREQLATEAAARSEAQRLAIDAQLRLLRAQLEPHMLFNTLANLRSLVREDVDRAESMIDQLIVYLRSALAASQTESVALSHEFAQLRAYLDIMALRMGPRLTCSLDLPPELEATAVPPMLLQPLVENAIKHGLEPKVGAGRIEVSARATAAGIEIRIDDNGLGLPADEGDGSATRSDGTSFGLQQVRDRLHAVYGAAAHLRLERRRPSGVSVLVLIPDRLG